MFLFQWLEVNVVDVLSLLSAVLAQRLFQLRGVQDGAEHDDLQGL